MANVRLNSGQTAGPREWTCARELASRLNLGAAFDVQALRSFYRFDSDPRLITSALAANLAFEFLCAMALPAIHAPQVEAGVTRVAQDHDLPFG